MQQLNEEVQKLAKEFEQCQKILTALGDENRQHLILEIRRLWIGCPTGGSPFIASEPPRRPPEPKAGA